MKVDSRVIGFEVDYMELSWIEQCVGFIFQPFHAYHIVISCYRRMWLVLHTSHHITTMSVLKWFCDLNLREEKTLVGKISFGGTTTPGLYCRGVCV